MYCPSCGAALEAGPFCPSCGARRPPQGESAAPADGWQTVQGVKSLTLKASTKCAHCAEPVPINGPTQSVICSHCEKHTSVRGLVGALHGRGGQGVSVEISRSPRAHPECPKCGKGVAIDAYLDKTGATTTLPCASCGASIPTYPAPQWLKNQLPAVLQVFGGEADVAGAPGIDLRVREDTAAPIAMACPSCGGGLTITTETARTLACTFCKASVFLPDELWKRLHPVKTMLHWTVTYSGQLQTKGEIEHREAERACAERKRELERAGEERARQQEAVREEARRAERRQEQEREGRERAKAQRIEAKWKRRGRVANYVMWCLVVPAMAGGWFVGSADPQGTAQAMGLPGPSGPDAMFALVFCLGFPVMMWAAIMRPHPIAKIDHESSRGDVLALFLFELVSFAVVVIPPFGAAALIAGMMGSR